MRGPNVQTRRRILDVALELFRSQGYDRTSLREISERLGFSKAALYYHFNAKEDILVALAGDLLDELERIIQAALANPDRSLAARFDVLNQLFDLILSHRATAELLLFEHPPLHDTDLGERVRRVLPQALEA
ncbi:MAG: TetR/AcrR family transcriptional regulator, partial [Micromonosporaceae bacterium]|nr:TetR/AcrR family transcriptional regulator [Micromonosporaceae bacterium]